MVTAGTYEKFPHFNTGSRLDFVLMSLFDFADEFGWLMQAWAVLINHYHFVGQSPDDPKTLRTMLRKLHSVIAVQINTEGSVRGRRVMDQYWDSHITFQQSYLARLNYVRQNPVHHGIVRNATDYPWCSAAWFERSSSAAFVRTVYSFKSDGSM